MPTPQKETPASGDNHTAGVNTQNTPEIIRRILTDARRFALLQARAARAGQTLQQTPTGYMLTRGNASKHCFDLGTVQALLQRMGA